MLDGHRYGMAIPKQLLFVLIFVTVAGFVSLAKPVDDCSDQGQ
jgi:hypothetical protein